MNSQKSLFTFLAIVPDLGLFAPSFKLSALAPRVLLIIVPYLITWCAAGVRVVYKHLPLRYLAIAGLVLIIVLGAKYSYEKIGLPRDYKGIARTILPKMRPDEHLPVSNRHWPDAPLSNFLPDAIFGNNLFSETLSASPDGSIWLITWPRGCALQETDEGQTAITNFDKIGVFRVRRACAELDVDHSLDNR